MRSNVQIFVRYGFESRIRTHIAEMSVLNLKETTNFLTAVYRNKYGIIHYF